MIPSRSHARTVGKAALAWGLCALLWGSAGCSRQFYRYSADDQVYGLVDAVATNPRWPLTNYTIEFDPRSRFAFPYSMERPPMPRDDIYAHRLMHCVDGMHGYLRWHKNGDVNRVDSPDWQCYLPLNSNHQLAIDHVAAMQLARIHSRDYQSQLETLYLSALDVTFERFRFETQFFGGNSTFYTADGRLRTNNAPNTVVGIGSNTGSFNPQPLAPSRTTGDSSSVLRTDTGGQAQRLYAGGGQLVVGVANSLVWQFSGSDSYNTNTLLDFSLFQPLLRFGGRARVLERLTFAERTLLSNVRQMEFYRRGFYVELITGAGNPQGPRRRGGLFGGSGLEGFSGVGSGGFGQVGANINTGGNAGALGGQTGAGAQRAGGFYGLLQQWREIENQESFIASLRDSLAQFEANYDAGRITRLQVDQFRQSLYLAQSALLVNKAAYEQAVDAFKIRLGLPPCLELEPSDPLLDKFRLIDPRLVRAQEQLHDLLDSLRAPEFVATPESMPEQIEALQMARSEVGAQLGSVEADFETLEANLPSRKANLKTIAERPDVRAGAVEAGAYDPRALDEQVTIINQDFETLSARFDQVTSELTAIEQDVDSSPSGEVLRRLITAGTELSGELAELQLIQARARLNLISLVPVELSRQRAFEIAAENRLDWMNARSSLVDTWRLIEFNANALKSDLNIIFNGDIAVTDNNPMRFRNTTGRLRVGFEFDAPLTRLAERNTFRQSLIDYQQARRSYMAVVDSIDFSLRNRLRQIALNQLNFEVRRAAVHIAISQVEQARQRLEEPPKAGEVSTLGPTTARDLSDALRNLLDAQNDFQSIWLNYEVQRMSLDYELGTMQLDNDGVWIDPGSLVDHSATEPLTCDPYLEELPPEHQPQLPISEETEEELPPPSLGQEPQGLP